jgi:hypothetical protein
MVGPQGFEHLNQRKQALIAESALRRIELRLELETIRASTARLTSVLESALRFGPWVVPLASLLGVVLGRRVRRRPPAPAPARGSVLRSVIRLARLIPTALSLWRRFAGRKSNAES